MTDLGPVRRFPGSDVETYSSDYACTKQHTQSLSRFNIDPRTRHLTTAKRALRYLKRTEDLRLVHTSGDLHGLADAYHAGGKSKKSVGE